MAIRISLTPGFSRVWRMQKLPNRFRETLI